MRLEQRALPRRFHLGVVCARLELTQRHGRCRKQRYAHELEHTDGVHRFQLQCSSWSTHRTWTMDVTAPEVAALVRAFVDQALATHEGGRHGPRC